MFLVITVLLLCSDNAVSQCGINKVIKYIYSVAYSIRIDFACFKRMIDPNVMLLC